MRALQTSSRNVVRIAVTTFFALVGSTLGFGSPSESMPVHELKIVFTVSGDPTDSPVSVTVGSSTTTIDTPRNDFEIGTTVGYLRLGTVAKISDISSLTIRVNGADSVRFSSFSIGINGHPAAGLYSYSSSWVPIDIGPYEAVTFSGAQLRANPSWKALTGDFFHVYGYTSPMPGPMLAALAGHAIAAPSPLKWKSAGGDSGITRVLDEHGACMKQTLSFTHTVTGTTSKTYEVRFTFHYGISVDPGKSYSFVIKKFTRTVLYNGNVLTSGIPSAVETAANVFYNSFALLAQEPRRDQVTSATISVVSGDVNVVFGYIG